MSDKYTSEELAEQDRPIVEQLERMYGTRKEDTQSLARIRARIMQNSAGPLPFAQPTSPYGQTPIPSQKRQAKEKDMRFIHIVTSREKPWQRRLSMIAAAILVVVLVGSLVLLVARRSQGTVAGLRPLQPGWTQVALFSGSGSKTFTHQNIVLSTLWGMSFGCVGQGRVDIEFDGQKNYSLPGSCQEVISVPYGPQIIELATAEHTIQTVKVTVFGSINWHLQFSNAQVTPAPLLATLLAPGSGWQEPETMSGIGNSFGSFISTSGVILPDARVIHPKIWGLVVVCSSTGNIQIALDPPVRGLQIATLICNQQPVLDILRFPSPPPFANIRVSTDSSVVWQIHVLACNDEHACISTSRDATGISTG